VGLMVFVKIVITGLIQFQFWDDVRDFILSPFSNPNLEVAVVLLIIPFFVNVSTSMYLEIFLVICVLSLSASNNEKETVTYLQQCLGQLRLA